MTHKTLILPLAAALVFSASSCSSPAPASDFPLPKVVSHRGFYVTGDSFENTISSLRNAQELGVCGVEFDVNLTLDDSVMILHGPNVHGTKVNIQKSTYEEVRAIDLPGGHKVPTFYEFLRQGKEDPSVTLVMELKKHATPERETQLVETVYAKIKEMGMLEQVQFMSFSLHACKEVRRIDPSVYVCYVSSDQRAETPATLNELGIKGVSYALNTFMNFPEMVDEANALGQETTLWMVEDPELIDWAWKHGITYVSTDFPDKAKAYIEALASGNKKTIAAAAADFKAKDKATFVAR